MNVNLTTALNSVPDEEDERWDDPCDDDHGDDLAAGAPRPVHTWSKRCDLGCVNSLHSHEEACRQDHTTLALAFLTIPVLGRHLDRAEAVDGDEDDGELRDEAHRVVHRQPQVAEYRPQLRRPVADQYVSEMEIGKLCGWHWKWS